MCIRFQLVQAKEICCACTDLVRWMVDVDAVRPILVVVQGRDRQDKDWSHLIQLDTLESHQVVIPLTVPDRVVERSVVVIGMMHLKERNNLIECLHCVNVVVCIWCCSCVTLFHQTTLGNDIIHEFQQLGSTVVYENQELKVRWLCPPNGPIFEGNLNAFRAELNQGGANRVVYICDCGKEGYVNPLTCNAWTIVLSSPNKKHYEGWLNPQGARAILRMFLPVWSFEEIQAVVPAIYPPRQSAQRDMNGEWWISMVTILW